MMVPRAYRFSSSPPRDAYIDEKSGGRWPGRKSTPAKANVTLPARPLSATRTTTEPISTPSKPMAVPQPERSYSGNAQTLPTRSRKMSSETSRQSTSTSAHDSTALPPAVAALLAMTTIPPPRPHQFRRGSRRQRRVSIDELVDSWKSDDSLKPSYSSSPALSILLEDTSDAEEPVVASQDSATEDAFLYLRSASSESMPSLDADDQSVLSMSSPKTPRSLRSRKSSSNLKRDRARPVVSREDTSLDHPLVPGSPVDEDDLILSTPSSRASTPKPRSTFTSNLTTSLRAFKNATLNSIASFTLSNATIQSQRVSESRFTDEMLWSHPFLFPRLSSEMRPAIHGEPTEAQRRYLNPPPLTFEEQEAPFQVALHAPYLAERIDETPTIPMQTYNRGKRKASTKRAASAPDPNSEAGRALLSPSGVRQREPRENSDFLRVVVLEMNMRREGKLESGRARIWLPPRQSVMPYDGGVKVPARWVGVSAYT